MKNVRIGNRVLPLWLIATLLISTVGSVALAYNVWTRVTIPFEIKEPIQILSYPSQLSLYPGETEEFNITVQNYASVNYVVIFAFLLSDTSYQQAYVTFSDENYTIVSGQQNLQTWVTVASNAPSINASLTIDIVRVMPIEETPSGWQVENYGGSYEIYPNGTIKLQSSGVGSLGSPITLYKSYTPTDDFVVSLKVKANQLGGFALFLRASLPFAGSTHGVNFEFGARDGGTFLLARSAGGWTWNIFATGTEGLWYIMKLTVHESPFSVKGEVFNEVGTLIGSLTINDMTNFGFNDIKYIGIGCWIPSEFLVRDFAIL